MAKKKPRPAKKKPSKAHSGDGGESGSGGGSDGGAGDLRARRARTESLFRSVAGEGLESSLDRAQMVIYEALETQDDQERIKLAREALALSPDCADAYVLLAEESESRKEALELYEQAVATGEKVLGPEMFEQGAGHFWGLLETRPYMRAREGLAHVLWSIGRRDEAIAHLQAMLRLNPSDNQGLRYTLAAWLLDEERNDELEALLNQYDERMAWCTYTRAALAFRREGDSAGARKRLAAAKKVNKHVPAYLVGDKPLPSIQPDSFAVGSDEEAVFYATGFLSGWRSTPGALGWLREKTRSAPRKTKAKREESQGPLPLVKTRLSRLPRELDVWQADFREVPQRFRSDDGLVRPWLVLVTSRSEDLIMGQRITEVAPTAEFLWDSLAEAMQEPAVGPSHRPSELQVRPDPRWDELGPHLEEVGIELEQLDELDMIDHVWEVLTEEIVGESPPGLLDVPGVAPEHVAGFYQAAAEFYRRAPWRKLGYESAIRIASDKFDSGPWYGVVMGQSGVTLGLALYDDLKTLKNLWTGRMSDEQSARETVALSLTYEDEAGVSDADLLAIEQYDFEIAGPDAYPIIFRKERGLSMRPPLVWELELMEGCLRAIPAFLARHQPDDTSEARMTVPIASGELNLSLTWLED